MRSARYHLIHETRVRYSSPVSLSQHLLHLTPRATPTQRVEDFRLTVSPEPQSLQTHEDWFGNATTWLALREPHRELCLIAAGTVEVLEAGARAAQPGPAWEEVAALLAAFPSPAPREALECALPSEQVPVLDELRLWALASFTPRRPLIEACRALMARIHREFAFDPGASTVATPVADTFRRRRGVCQDFALLMLSALRSLGLAARYLSGYILTHPAPGQPRLIGADASHAWVEVWCPGLGWAGFDPTNALEPGLEHIVLGWGRDFADVSPTRGVILGGAAHELAVRVTVMPAGERSLRSLLAEMCEGG